MAIPNDPIILLSYINTQLRDFYPTLKSLGEGLDVDIEEIKTKLAGINYEYDENLNKFV